MSTSSTSVRVTTCWRLVGRGAVGAGRLRSVVDAGGLAVGGLVSATVTTLGGVVASAPPARDVGVGVGRAVLVVPSASLAEAVIPTVWRRWRCPRPTVLAVSSESDGVVTSNSSSSVRAMVKALVEVEPSSEVVDGDVAALVASRSSSRARAVDAHDGDALVSKSPSAAGGVDDHGVGECRPSRRRRSPR